MFHFGKASTKQSAARQWSYMFTCICGNIFSTVASTSIGFHNTTAIINLDENLFISKSLQDHDCIHISSHWNQLGSPSATFPDLPGPSLGPRWALLDLFGPSLDLLGPASFWDSQQTRLSQKDDQQSPTFKIVQTQPFLETDFFIRGHCAVRIAPPQNVHTWGFSCLACTSESRPPSKI